MKFRLKPAQRVINQPAESSVRCRADCATPDCRLCNVVRTLLRVIAPFDRAPKLGSLSPLSEHACIKQNMLLVGPWAIVSSHIRDALMRRNRDILFTLTEGQLFGSRNHRFSFNYTTDFEVMKAFFADKYAGGERVPHYSLLVDESYELVVIRIGRAAKNSIVPERLQELVEYRVDRNKPTWVVTDRPWAQGHPVWSPELAETLETFGVFEPEPEPEGGEEVA